ncbi:MAG: sulfatase-like hydrolase/transferase [Candidatus Brocadiia bacterium]
MSPPVSRRQFLRSVGLGAAALAAPRRRLGAAPAPAPNIVLIMTDDMGFSDIGCYGGEIRTPNLDALAGKGIRFTHFFNTARCCPTRASLMTGLYPHQAGIGHMMGDYGLPGYRGDLSRNAVTIPEVLRPAGYATYMAGKWHVTPHTGPEGPKHNWPCQRGYDRFFGTIHGAGSFYDPNSLTRDNTQIPPGEGFYYTDAISDNAARFIRDHARSRPQAPFFLYVPYTAPHWPMHAKPEDIAKYKGRYARGWDALRRERHARMIKMGIVDEKWPLSPRDPRAPAWEDADLKPWHERRMEVYAAMVDCVDQGVGRILEALADTGRLDDTLVLFLADNGGCAEEMGSRGPVRPDPQKVKHIEPLGPDELQRRMVPRATRDGRPVRQGRGVMPGPADTYVAYGLPWANASNTPFRRYKHWVHEGGIASPLILHWPKGIAAELHGSLYHQPAHLVDLMATCADLAGASYPAEFQGHAIKPMEGVSLAPALRGKPLTAEPRPLFWEHEGNKAARLGRWKLVAVRGGPWELYDLEADRTELSDLAEKMPQKTRDMVALWEAWADRANVAPWGSWRRGRGGKGPTSKKTRFELEQGDELPRARAPMVKERPFTVTVVIEPKSGEGVIVAQGGHRCGWALYLDDGHLAFARRRDQELAIVRSEDKLPPGKTTVTTKLGADGSVAFAADGKALAASGKLPGPVHDMPDEPLNVGRDVRAAVGEYPEGDNRFEGTIHGVRIELGKP